MTMNPLPPSPSSKDPTSFDDRADELLAVALPRFVEEANDLAEDVSTKQETASTAAVTATGQAGIATTKAGEAGDHASAANDSKEAAAASALSAFTNMGFAEQAAIAANASKLAAAESAATIDPQALSSDYAGEEEPPVIWPHMTWADTGNMRLKRRNAANSAWAVEGELLQYKANRNGDATQTFKAAPSAAPDDVVVRSQVILGELLASGVANNSASVVLSWTDTDFTRYEVEWSAARPGTNQAVLFAHLSINGGVSYIATLPHYASVATATDGAIDYTGHQSDLGFRIGGSGAVGIAVGGQGSSGRLISHDIAFKLCNSQGVFDSTKIWSVTAAHFGINTSPVNAIRFSMNVGDILSGNFRIYGVR